MMFVIPTWRVTVKADHGGEDETYRVPETNLDSFLHVLTFNKMEFDVRKEQEGGGANV